MKSFITTAFALAASLTIASAACSGDGCKKKKGDGDDPALTTASIVSVDKEACKKKKGDGDDPALASAAVDHTGCKKKKGDGDDPA